MKLVDLKKLAIQKFKDEYGIEVKTKDVTFDDLVIDHPGTSACVVCHVGSKAVYTLTASVEPVLY